MRGTPRTGTPALGARRQAVLLWVVGIIVLAGTVAATTQVEDSFRASALHDELSIASIARILTVERDITMDNVEGSEIDPSLRRDLDADVDLLRDRSQVIGIEVWGMQGGLIYADSGHDPNETQLPEDELRQLSNGRSFAQNDPDGSRGVALLAVFQPADLDLDGDFDAGVEVLLPLSRLDDAVGSSVLRLRIGAAIVLFGTALTLVMMRRRLRLRNHQAEHDPLTGLGNRTLLARRGADLTRLRNGQTAVPDVELLLIDLDGFKRVNDSLGHAVGDSVLVAVAERMKAVVCDGHELVRLGGDEFAVLVPTSLDGPGAEMTGDRIIDVLVEPICVGAISVQIGASIGLASRNGDPNVTVGELLRRADVAMYQAKRGGGGLLRYSAATDDNDADHLILLGDIRRALQHEELVLQYQPKIDAGGRLTGVEALLRWNHPRRGLLAPMEFLPLVEETAIMKPLTVWVLDHAGAQAAVWKASGLHVPVAVNVSPRTLLDPGFIDMVRSMLTANGLTGKHLTIEITETAILSDPVRASQVCDALRGLEVSVSIDDFGTGFTSLAHLKHLPVSEIKIDRTFVSALLEGGADNAIVSYTIRLAHELGIPVVAEGVESAAALDELTLLGCDQFQGFLIAHPLDSASVETWVRHRVDLPTLEHEHEHAALVGSAALRARADRRPRPGVESGMLP